MVELIRADPDRVASMETAQPDNPFAARAYAEAMADPRSTWMIAFDGHDPAAWALAVIDAGRIRKQVTIPSLPLVHLNERMLKEVERAAASIGATSIRLNTFCSPPGTRIEPGDHTALAARYEYRWDVSPDDLYAVMSKSHRERARQADRKGVTVHRSTDPVLLTHIGDLHANSIARRQRRGESVVSGGFRTGEALLASGSGEIFYAEFEGAVVAAVLTIKSSGAAYTVYSGNAAEGLRLGASHLLRVRMAELLRDSGVSLVVLGGASEEQGGLRDFKRRFGASEVPLTTLTLDCARGWRRIADRALRLAARRPDDGVTPDQSS